MKHGAQRPNITPIFRPSSAPPDDANINDNTFRQSPTANPQLLKKWPEFPSCICLPNEIQAVHL